MKQTEITCTVCPRGCRILVTDRDGQIEKIENYSCPRGLKYAREEFTHPVRILTTSVKLSGSDEPLLPVRSRGPLPKEKLLACAELLRSVCVLAPLSCGDVIVQNILDTGVDIIASADAGKE